MGELSYSSRHIQPLLSIDVCGQLEQAEILIHKEVSFVLAIDSIKCVTHRMLHMSPYSGGGGGGM
jgi:hypothetical protein